MSSLNNFIGSSSTGLSASNYFGLVDPTDTTKGIKSVPELVTDEDTYMRHSGIPNTRLQPRVYSLSEEVKELGMQFYFHGSGDSSSTYKARFYYRKTPPIQSWNEFNNIYQRTNIEDYWSDNYGYTEISLKSDDTANPVFIKNDDGKTELRTFGQWYVNDNSFGVAGVSAACYKYIVEDDEWTQLADLPTADPYAYHYYIDKDGKRRVLFFQYKSDSDGDIYKYDWDNDTYEKIGTTQHYQPGNHTIHSFTYNPNRRELYFVSLTEGEIKVYNIDDEEYKDNIVLHLKDFANDNAIVNLSLLDDFNVHYYYTSLVYINYKGIDYLLFKTKHDRHYLCTLDGELKRFNYAYSGGIHTIYRFKPSVYTNSISGEKMLVSTYDTYISDQRQIPLETFIEQMHIYDPNNKKIKVLAEYRPIIGG